MGTEIVAAGWLAGAGITSGTVAGTVAAVAINIAISAALSAAAQAIAGTADQGANKATRTGNIKQALTPHEWVYGSVRKGGAIFYVNGSGGSNWVLHLNIAFAAHEIEEFGDLYINGELCGLDLIKPSDYLSNVLGAEGPFARYPDLDDSYQVYVPGRKFGRRALASFQFRKGSSDPAVQTAVPFELLECKNWDANHRALGRAYLYARLVYEETGKAWPSFIPAFTCRVKGKRLYDPRSGLIEWSDNPALVASDILENLMGIPRSRIDSAALIEAANICEEDVPLKGGGSEKRYRACGYILIQGEPEDWLNPIAMAMAGAVIEHHGTYYIHAGKWRQAEISITDADVMGTIRVQTAVGDRDRANSCRATFAGVDSFDQPTDAPVVVDTAAVIEDGGPQEMEINLEWSPSHTQAQRVSKIMLLTQRGGRSISIGTNLLKGLDVKPWDTVNLTLDSFGISGTFRVIESVVTISDGVMAPTLSLQEISPQVYAWDETTDEQPLIVNSSIIPGTAIEPQNLDFTTAVVTSDSTFDPAVVTVTWDDPGNTSFDAIEVEAILHFQYRVGAGLWIDQVTETKGEAVPGAETLALTITDESFASAAYQFQGHQIERVRIRTRINDQSWSEWVTQDGDLQAPVAGTKATTFYTTRGFHQPALVKMSWGAPTDGTPSGYEVEVNMTYDWKQGAHPYVTTTYTERKTLKGKSLNLTLWDKSKPPGSTQFQNHVLNVAQVRAVSTDGTVSSWTVL